MFLLLCLTLAAIVYVQVGYAVIMGALARLCPRKSQPTLPMPEAVSIILCVHNGAAGIEKRLRNLLELEWHGEREILVCCDGCTDATAPLAAQADPVAVRVLEFPQQRGKAAVLNDAVKNARHAVIVFADLRQTFDRQALSLLAAAFRDPAVGAVSGLLRIAPSEAGGGKGLDIYWRMETKLREWEARVDSVIGSTGAIHAIRRELFTDLRAGTILDDVVVPMQIASQGWRVAYEPRAVAHDPQPLAPEKEKQRKLRTLAGNYQMLFQHPCWLLPWRNRLWWQIISHKYARLMVPWLMVVALLLTLMQPKTPVVWLLLWLQVLCYSLAVIGSFFPRLKARWITIPSGFLMLQWTCARAFFSYLRCRKDPLLIWAAGPRHPQMKPEVR